MSYRLQALGFPRGERPTVQQAPEPRLPPKPSVELYTVLTLVDHGNALLENAHHGHGHYRYLNRTGRWSSAGTRTVPLLHWTDPAKALAAASSATVLRRRDVKATTVSSEDPSCFQLFSDALAPALAGYLPYTATAATKLAAERTRLQACVVAVLGAYGHLQQGVEPGEAMKRGAAVLREHGVPGTVFSAAQYLTGKKAAGVASSWMQESASAGETQQFEAFLASFREALAAAQQRV